MKHSEEYITIQDGLEKGFGYIERAYSMGVNPLYGPIQTNIPHAALNYKPGKSNSEVDYYRQTYFSPEKYLISGKTEK